VQEDRPDSSAAPARGRRRGRPYGGPKPRRAAVGRRLILCRYVVGHALRVMLGRPRGIRTRPRLLEQGSERPPSATDTPEPPLRQPLLSARCDLSTEKPPSAPVASAASSPPASSMPTGSHSSITTFSGPGQRRTARRGARYFTPCRAPAEPADRDERQGRALPPDRRRSPPQATWQARCGARLPPTVSMRSARRERPELARLVRGVHGERTDRCRTAPVRTGVRGVSFATAGRGQDVSDRDADAAPCRAARTAAAGAAPARAVGRAGLRGRPGPPGRTRPSSDRVIAPGT
jgi:hypothetical protein